jgi:hypothetical protein
MNPWIIRHHLFFRRNRRLGAGREGIAIGMILFIVVMIGIVASILAIGTGDFGSAGISDRISATIPNQAVLIRTKINQCNTQYQTAYSLCVPGNPCSVALTDDPYPLSNTTTGTDVSALLCDPMGTQSLWADNTLVPQAVTGFADWYYIDASATDGGRCIWTQPTTNNPSSDAAMVNGLSKATAQFSSGTTYSASNEVIYDPASTSQKFVLWITMPTGTPNSNCLP